MPAALFQFDQLVDLQEDQSMMCPFCYASNEDGNVFCVNCNKRLKP